MSKVEHSTLNGKLIAVSRSLARRTMERADTIRVGQRLKACRRERHWSQQRLSDATEISRKQISHYETGYCAIPIKRLKRLAHALGVDLDFRRAQK